MPKYIVDGILHLNFRWTVEAASDVEAKEIVKNINAADLQFYNEKNTKSIIEVNPTVEVVQEK
jgi:hypothetical protein